MCLRVAASFLQLIIDFILCSDESSLSVKEIACLKAVNFRILEADFVAKFFPRKAVLVMKESKKPRKF